MPEILSSDLLLRQAKKIRANKKLGQNFFVDLELLERIADAVDIEEGDHIVEIGPGLGFLTKVLSARASALGVKIDAIELDRTLAEKLTKQGIKSVKVIQADFLDFDLSSIEAERIKIVGNIPYQITSPIIGKLFGELGKPSAWLSKIDRVVMTIQMEVAKRLVASPGSKAFSQLTLLKSYYFDAEILMTVPPEAFYPVPEVTSAVVFLDPLEAPPISVDNLPLMKKIISAGFKQRRKMLKNNLQFLNLDENDYRTLFQELNVSPHARAEDLSLEKFAQLVDLLEEMDQKTG